MGLIMPLVILPGVTNNMTGVAVLTSKVISLVLSNSASIQAIWTGTPTGVFSIQSSLDYSENGDGSVKNPGTWDDLGIGVVAPSGSSGSAFVDMALTGIFYIRVVYTNSSGTGTLVVFAGVK